MQQIMWSWMESEDKHPNSLISWCLCKQLHWHRAYGLLFWKENRGEKRGEKSKWRYLACCQIKTSPCQITRNSPPRARQPKKHRKMFSNQEAQMMGIFVKWKRRQEPWLVWLSGLSAGLWTKGSPVQLPLRAHAWVMDQLPRKGHTRGNHTLLFLSLSFSLPSPLSKNK